MELRDMNGSALPYRDIPEDWPNSLPAAFYMALEEFNRQAYFACHETLESLWIPEKRTVREVYQGVLQIAVGCYHLTVRANWVGAVNKLDAGARRLERAGSGCLCPMGEERSQARGPYGVAWSRLIQDADRLQIDLRSLGAQEIDQYDRGLLPLISYRTLD